MGLTNPKVLVVLVNWNGWADTIECLESCSSLAYPNYELVVVDNGSTDDSVERITGHSPATRIICTGVNLGFAGANNVAIREALDRDFGFVWLLNNDTAVDSAALGALVETAEADPTVGVVGSKIYYHSQPDVLWFAGGFINRTKGYAYHRGAEETDVGQYDVAGPVEYVTGASMLVRVDAIRQVGVMAESYFLYWEEADWNARIARAGWRTIYQPRSIVWHKVGRSTGNEDNPVRARYNGRNRILYFQRNQPARAFLVTIMTLAQSAWLCLRGKPAVGIAQARGVLDALLGRSGYIAP